MYNANTLICLYIHALFNAAATRCSVRGKLYVYLARKDEGTVGETGAIIGRRPQ